MIWLNGFIKLIILSFISYFCFMSDLFRNIIDISFHIKFTLSSQGAGRGGGVIKSGLFSVQKKALPPLIEFKSVFMHDNEELCEIVLC